MESLGFHKCEELKATISLPSSPTQQVESMSHSCEEIDAIDAHRMCAYGRVSPAWKRLSSVSVSRILEVTLPGVRFAIIN